MIVYQATKSKFLHDSHTSDIEKKILEAFTARVGHAVAKNEVKAWKSSLDAMAKVLMDDEIPAEAGIAIEYIIPQTSKRVDMLITGTDVNRDPRVVIVELKQWETAELTGKDGVVATYLGGSVRETSHPSYQAWSYAVLLEDFNEAVEKESIALSPCAYLHNYEPDSVIGNDHYRKYIERAPIFIIGDGERKKLQDFIKKHVKYGDNLDVLYKVENGRIRPSKMLADSMRAMMKGQKEFLLIDDQKVVFETALALARQAQQGAKQVYIVEGGPGTGKSVVAINLLAALLHRDGDHKEQNCRYVSRNAAPRKVYESKLTGQMSATRIRNLFSGSGAFVDPTESVFDTLIVDEAHRLNEKSGLYGNKGENQIKEIIRASQCSIFFIDEAQRVTWRDIGAREQIRAFASEAGAEISEGALESQFRCNGSDGYLPWIDNTLAIRKTANEVLDGAFEVKVFDSPVELHAAVVARNRASNKARIVAGYCWDWKSKRVPTAFDVEIPQFGYRKKWNLTEDGSLWIIAKESVDQVGCIHTCQGLEVDYIGVIIGDDLVVRDGQVICQPEKRSRHDQSIKGWRTAMRANPVATKTKVDAIVKNTYRTLMTRGMKGCYIYCTDSETSEYFKRRIGRAEIQSTNVIPFKPRKQVRPYVDAVPVVDLKIAAGRFSDFQAHDTDADSWVVLPEGQPVQEGMFVAQVVGESMNRKIPSGAWCLFRLNPQGTRNGKIVLAQHRKITDPDTGGTFTIKEYRSTKSADDDGTAKQIEVSLFPNSEDTSFLPLRFGPDSVDELHIVAEFIRVL